VKAINQDAVSMLAGRSESCDMDRRVSSWHHINWHPYHSHSGNVTYLLKHAPLDSCGFLLFNQKVNNLAKPYVSIK